MGEFDLIARYFVRATPHAALGIGDDCALIAQRPDAQLAVSSDMLIEGRHFLAGADPEALGRKALAVNLSDLAACGATPRAYTLALALPKVDERFLAAFARGLHSLADAHAIELIGGDTTAGPLTVCITVLGDVVTGQALLRSGAKVGDTVWVSHASGAGIGDARLALAALNQEVSLSAGDLALVRIAMDRPQPRVALGLALVGVASAAIDLSDGLIGDLGHVLARSQVGARIDVDVLPCSDVMTRQSLATRRLCQIAGGDDYELLFTASASRTEQVRAAATRAGVQVRPIGVITAQPGLALHDAQGDDVANTYSGFDHFRA